MSLGRKHPHIWFYLCCSVFICGQPCFASGFEFADFSSTKDLQLIRDTYRSGKKVLRLTEANKFLAGAAWFKEKQPVAAGFETTFTFKLTGQDSNDGADGLAFLVQNEGPHAIGGVGASGGFLRNDNGAPTGTVRPIVKTVAVFFDTYANFWDPSGNHVMICINNEVPNMTWPPRCLAYSQTLKPKLKDGKPHTARIVYQPPRLSVFIDDSTDPVDAASLDLARIIGGDGTAWVGFTASTGGSYQNHDLLSWKFDAGPRGSATSSMSVISSTISFQLGTCMTGKTLCTPEQAIVQEKGPGEFHVYLPAHLEWGASVPNPGMAGVRIYNMTGTVCWDPQLRDTSGCNGHRGNGTVPGKEAEGAAGFIAPHIAAGALVARSLNGRTWFSVNDRTGDPFKDNEGFFEFDVAVGVK